MAKGSVKKAQQKKQPLKRSAATGALSEKAEHAPKDREVERTGILRERAMLARFSVARWYGTGADESVVNEVRKKHEASGDIGTFTKRFMSRDRLAAINQVTNEARKYHKQMTLAWGDSGSRLLSVDLYFDYKKEMTAYSMRFDAAVEEFMANYPAYIKKEKERLNGLFKESDYPTEEEMRERFAWRLLIEPLPSAEDFRVDLGESEVKRLRSEIEQNLETSLVEASHELWNRLEDLVSKLKDRLDHSDSSPRAALFDNLRDIVTLLPRMNVMGDPKLKQIGERISSELLSADIGAVREDDVVRKEVSSKADKLLDIMSTYSGKSSSKQKAGAGDNATKGAKQS